MTTLTNFEEQILPYISDGYFLINNTTREMTLTDINGEELNNVFYIGAELDVNIQHVIIKLPNKYEGKELKDATYVRIFLQVGTNPIGFVEINENRQYYDANNDCVYIDWIVGPDATQVAGQAFLSLCLQNKLNETTIQWEFNSQPIAAQIVQTLHSTEKLVTIEYDAFQSIDSWQNSDYVFLDDNSIIDWSKINDVNKIIYIDKNTRTITMPELFDFGIETDHNVKYVFVAFPKIYEGTIFNTTDWNYYASYTNADGESDKSLLVKNATAIDDEYIYVAWIITIGVTEAAGVVQFSFFAANTEDFKIKQAFNTLYDNALVNKTVLGGERLTIMSDDKFQEALVKGLTYYFANNNVVFDGDVW